MHNRINRKANGMTNENKLKADYKKWVENTKYFVSNLGIRLHICWVLANFQIFSFKHRIKFFSEVVNENASEQR